MKRSILPSLSLCTLLLLLFSCGKEKLPGTSGELPLESPESGARTAATGNLISVARLKKLTYVNADYYQFQYDGYGRLYKVVSTGDSVTYTYTSGYLTIRKYSRPTKALKATLKGALDSKGRLTNLKGNDVFGPVDAVYTYDASGRLAQRMSKVTDGITVKNVKTIFTWTNGDLVKESLFIDGGAGPVNLYGYDAAKANKLNVYPMQELWVDGFLGLPSQHLRTKTILNAGAPNQFITTESWTLNAQGLPASSKLYTSFVLPSNQKYIEIKYAY
ncbi:MAG TPA: hypothetical protein VHK69_22225 [Chitinophagaceae bacterium]|jgi:hypothetical protein|nr:hypothetical protein [Chitinophagaceae bacterium]